MRRGVKLVVKQALAEQNGYPGLGKAAIRLFARNRKAYVEIDNQSLLDVRLRWGRGRLSRKERLP